MSDAFHFPPELLDLLSDTVPKLTRTKRGVIDFFRGAGAPSNTLRDLEQRLIHDKSNLSKYEIARTILVRLNAGGDHTLRERREVIKRVVEFENFSSCWDNDRLAAKGLVAEIRRIVGTKDAFTRMQQERDKESEKRREAETLRLSEVAQREEALSKIKSDLFGLFTESNPQLRGKRLEAVLNSLFAVDGILITESFTLTGDASEGIIEQIDGVVEIDGMAYLVEMKWWNKPLGPADVSQHLMNVFFRSQTGGILISGSGFTPSAEIHYKQALQERVAIMCHLEEFVHLLERNVDIKLFLKCKINAARVHKNPFHEPLKNELAA